MEPMAPPQHKFAKATQADRDHVERLAGIGLPADQIALVMSCSESTLHKYFAEQLATGVAKANAKVASYAFGAAAKGNVSMIIFLCKTRLGWRETNHHEHTGAGGIPLIPVMNIGQKPEKKD